MFSSNSMSPLPKRRKINVDEDTVTGNEANGESGIDSELELDDDTKLREVVEDIEPEATQEQTTTVLGLRSGKSWAEAEAKLRASYSGASIQTSKKRQEEKKEAKNHARQFHKMTKYFLKSSASPAPAPAPARVDPPLLHLIRRPSKVRRSRRDDISMSRESLRAAGDSQIAILGAQEQAGPPQISKR
jgi:hypothetical protein